MSAFPEFGLRALGIMVAAGLSFGIAGMSMAQAGHTLSFGYDQFRRGGGLRPRATISRIAVVAPRCDQAPGALVMYS